MILPPGARVSAASAEAVRGVRAPELVHLRHLRRPLLLPQVPGGAPGDPVPQVDSVRGEDIALILEQAQIIISYCNVTLNMCHES